MTTMRWIASNSVAATLLLLLLLAAAPLGNGLSSGDDADDQRITGLSSDIRFPFNDTDKGPFKNPITDKLDKNFIKIFKDIKPNTDNSTAKIRTKRSYDSRSIEPELYKPYSRYNKTNEVFMADVTAERVKRYKSVMEFRFNIHRQRIMSKATKIPKWTKGIIYWMHRDQRIHDNWALLYAQKLAIEKKLPLHIAFVRPDKVVDSTMRHYNFIFEGLKEIEKECISLNIQFHFLTGEASLVLPTFVRYHQLGALVADFEPFREHTNTVKKIAHSVPPDVPVLQIDAHNVVPAWVASDKQEHVTRGMRIHIEQLLSEFYTEFPPVIKHPFQGRLKAQPTNWEEAEKNFEIDRSVPPVIYYKPGYIAGMYNLNRFIRFRLRKYNVDRFDPLKNGLSNLSPWLHFGQISAQRVVLEITKLKKTWPDSVSIFREEVLIRREFSDNFCLYNSNYDSFDGGPSWGREALNKHRNDTRFYVYSREEFENSSTHDDLWNSAQLQMVADGKIHRLLRQYWAKKILEYSIYPEDAIATANYLNNKYSIDGRDPNGYVGVLWAMVGLHDKPWKDRPIFGKIRYLTTMGIRKKFNALGYISRYGGQIHQFTKP